MTTTYDAGAARRAVVVHQGAGGITVSCDLLPTPPWPPTPCASGPTMSASADRTWNRFSE
ncbi:hypothetical protein OG589_17345 [Sphaerisporangium sp. NBC_01403]|uniref:hypothetical protein n=1 Tax=Sphaerisporangium sp. NBC_01403 TaxID=2903599 RepID=UPI00324FC0D0